MFPEKELTFSKFDYKSMIKTKSTYAINLLKNISCGINHESVMTFFDLYKGLLVKTIEECEAAKVETELTLKAPRKKRYEAIPAYIKIGQQEWMQVKKPDQIEFDLAKNWPLSDELNAYKDKILSVLPSDIESLKDINSPKVCPVRMMRTLLLNQKLAICYAKSAGVIEGYTVAKHTEMVLELAVHYRNYLSITVEHLVNS